MLLLILLEEFREDYKNKYNLNFTGSKHNFEQSRRSRAKLIYIIYQHLFVVTEKRNTCLLLVVTIFLGLQCNTPRGYGV